MTKLANKVVWVTGASSGIGEALVYALAARKTKLILSARRVDELERVKGNCPPDVQPNIRILPLDLAKSDTLKLSAEAAIQYFGHVDVLINNGGVSQRGFARDTTLDVDRIIMETNFFGAVGLAKGLLPHFIARKQGHIVVVSSVTGKFGTPWRSAYAASKHALHGFFDSLRAEEWQNNLKVTLACPGFISTPITLSALTGSGKALGERDESNRRGKSPAFAARRILRAIRRNKNEVYFGGFREILAVYVKRYFPGRFAKIIRKARVR